MTFVTRTCVTGTFLTAPAFSLYASLLLVMAILIFLPDADLFRHEPRSASGLHLVAEAGEARAVQGLLRPRHLRSGSCLVLTFYQ